MGESPLVLASIFGPVFGMYFALGALFVPFVLYLIARWRSHRDGVVDPQLGLKVALGFFASTAFQILCVGVTLLLYAAVASADESRGEMARFALGLAIPGGVVMLVMLVLLRATNHRECPAIDRMFVGYNLLLLGVVAMIAIVGGSELMVRTEPAGDTGKLAAAAAVVYGAAWARLAFWLFRASAPKPAAVG